MRGIPMTIYSQDGVLQTIYIKKSKGTERLCEWLRKHDRVSHAQETKDDTDE